MKKYHLYGMGNALVDAIYQVQENFIKIHGIQKGVMTLIDEKRQTSLMADLHRVKGKWRCGGSAANTIIGASQFGAKTYYSCRVANDDFGHFFTKEMESLGVDSNITEAKLPQGVTGKCLVMVTDDADRTMNTFLGISESFSSEDLDMEALKNSEFLYVEGYLVTSPTAFEGCKKAIKFARKNGVKVALTLSDPAIVENFSEKFWELIHLGVDLLFCNEDEMETLTAGEGHQKISPLVQSYAMTKGPKGALIWDGKKEYYIQGVKVEAIDTNGAGDMFAGAFLYGLINKKCFKKAGEFACLASSELVTKLRPRLLLKEAMAIHQSFF